MEHEVFWRTVIHFFVNNHPMLSTTYIDPIIDYVRHQKYVPERTVGPDGAVVDGSPPKPNFSMKGRSAAKLIRLVDDWHTELSGLEDVPYKSWNPCGHLGFEHEEIDSELARTVRWTIDELLTSGQLGVEGRVMHHCVASYVDRCASGERSIWSMRVTDLEALEPEPLHVLTIAVDPARKQVVEARGKHNLKPFDGRRASNARGTRGLYMHFLRESPRILRMWMDREGMTHG